MKHWDSMLVGVGVIYALNVGTMPTWLAIDIPIWVAFFLLGLWLPRRRR